MAFSLAKLVTKTVSLFRPVAAAASSCRFLNTDTYLRRSDFDPFDYEGILNLNGRFCNEDIRRVRRVLNDAYCSKVSASRNLANLLNMMDEEIQPEKLGPSGCLRWDVMEDGKALYLVRDMSRHRRSKKGEKVEEVVEGICSIFGRVRVSTSFHTIQIIVGSKGPYPGVKYPGYLIDIYLPASVYKEEVWDDITMEKKNGITNDVKNDILKITIPKKTEDMIPSITTQIKFY